MAAGSSGPFEYGDNEPHCYAGKIPSGQTLETHCPPIIAAHPPFRLTDVLSGKTVALEDLRGRTVVLHFGASW